MTIRTLDDLVKYLLIHVAGKTRQPDPDDLDGKAALELASWVEEMVERRVLLHGDRLRPASDSTTRTVLHAACATAATKNLACVCAKLRIAVGRTRQLIGGTEAFAPRSEPLHALPGPIVVPS
jgi:hypothetical protein